MSKILNILSLFAVVLVTINVLGLTVFVSTFYANQAYFEKVYCVNKDKPELECHGQCHLKKVVQAETSQETPQVQTTPFSMVYTPSFFVWQPIEIATEYLPNKRYIESTYARVDLSLWSPPWNV